MQPPAPVRLGDTWQPMGRFESERLRYLHLLPGAVRLTCDPGLMTHCNVRSLALAGVNGAI